MAEISFIEKRAIEAFLDMGSGYVLNFSDRTFQDFVFSTTGIDVSVKKYKEGGTSKANRLRTFMKLEPDVVVGKLFKELYQYKVTEDRLQERETNVAEAEEFDKVANRLLEGRVVDNIDAIQANNDDKDFHQLAKLIKESIEKNQPEAALDRLHTFMIKFLKELCRSHGVSFDKDDTVNALFGKYMKAVKAKGWISSPMAEKIVQFSFQVIDAFNDIRNNKSFAHDNPVLNYDESVLIFSNVSATVKFLQSLESKNKNVAVAEAKPDWGQF
ncbi:abortive infection family protein [Chitinophaga sancti]|uniref:Abortive infection C-terminus n=1 Tax=Chitinophaga sancti TaxID=1004 RepID=A0A1K1SSQ5_9BACT|nr:abortive infection family protein [Chitinophaga sancti]WQD65415.1 abortive infection family protein [Chitinophaga sancti]WQG88962.1 abortive infection family protein [Chitinophaga sancti]SFW87347.1 Abortive infection C-terminus [Chitinophaga sancti]